MKRALLLIGVLAWLAPLARALHQDPEFSWRDLRSERSIRQKSMSFIDLPVNRASGAERPGEEPERVDGDNAHPGENSRKRLSNNDKPWTSERPGETSGHDAEPRLEATLEPQAPWVQQQVRYRMRLYRDSHLQQGDFLVPEIPGVLVRRGAARGPLPVRREGREMELLEQEWLLFPQRSGLLELPPPVFTGRDFYLRGPALQLRVRPRPAGSGDFPWLVTPELRAEERWNGALQGLRPGAFRMREIRLEARQVAGAQLPPLEPVAPPGFRVQRVASRAWDVQDETGLRGLRLERFRYLAVAPGEGELPPLVIRWWNPRTGAVQQLELPPRPYRIAVPAGAREAETASAAGAAPAARSGEPAAGRERWQALAAWMLVLLAGALLAWRRRRALRERGRWLLCQLQLLAACLHGDAAGARRAIRRWLGPEAPAGLAGEAARAWAELDERLYGASGPGGWRGMRAWKALRRLLGGGGGERRAPTPLPPLWCRVGGGQRAQRHRSQP